MDNHNYHSQNQDGSACDDAVFLAEVADLPPEKPQRPKSRWLNRATIMVAVLLVLGPVIYLGLPDEVARWYVAAAIEAYEDGDTVGALRHMDAASRWGSDNPAIYVYLGSWKQQEGDYEGSLVQYNKVLEIDATDEWALVQRSQVLQHLGRHVQSIADWKKLASSSAMSQIQRRVMYLNGLAYAQALGDTELDAALENIENAINSVGQNAAMLDTRGFIQYRRGDLKSAKADLELAVKLVEDEYSQAARVTQYIQPREFEASLKAFAQSVAVIRYHRSLVFDALEEPDAAANDRARVRELGFEPGEHLF
jgi:tetratricopeptide (TPR) repeat protein